MLIRIGVMMPKDFNRQEAQDYVRAMTTGHHENATSNHYVDIAKAVDDIFDGLDSRRCENCKHLYTPKAKGFKHQCNIGMSSGKYFDRDIVSLTFGCPEFKRKSDA